LAESTVKNTERLYGRKISNEFLPLDDLLINGFMLLAREVGPNNSVEHRVILLGLMKFLDASINQNAQISPLLLREVKSYLELYKLN